MENIGQLFSQISKKLVFDINKKLKEFDLTISQLKVIVVLKEANKNICQKDLSERLNIKSSSLIDSLKILERKDLIRRTPSLENAKYTMVELTDKGRSILSVTNLGKDHTEEMICRTLGFRNTEEMILKFQEVLTNLETHQYYE
ncbi:MAG: winged helix DNA-binding protein [Bacilli bacterium]